LRPKLQAKDFERRKSQHLADLAQRIGNPRYLAQVAASETIFGKSHPYGHPASGTPETIETISLTDVKGYLAAHNGPKACALVVAGDVTLEQATALAEKHLAGWKGDAMPSPAPGAPKLAPRSQVVLVPKPGLNQTVVIMGRPGVAAGNPMEAPLELASTVFGGFFGSRLNMNLREAKGYTYGAGAGLDARKGPGPVTASSSVRADVTGPAVQEFYSELKGLKSRPITTGELEPAREGVIRAIPGGFDTVEGLAGTASSIFYKDMPLDRLQQIVAELQKADAASVQSAAESFFEPEYLRIVLVGDPALVREQVAPLNLGTLVEQAPPAMPSKK
jgi:zinc protease